MASLRKRPGSAYAAGMRRIGRCRPRRLGIADRLLILREAGFGSRERSDGALWGGICRCGGGSPLTRQFSGAFSYSWSIDCGAASLTFDKTR
jgi:hypothetical protein